MRRRVWFFVALALALALVGATVLSGWLFTSDMQRARAHAAHGSVLIATRCGPIEYQEAGTGVIGSDFLFWAALHVARDQVIKVVLATPPELLTAASKQERTRVNAMLENILPVSARAEGLRSDTAASKHLTASPLQSIHLPALVISDRDDRYGTYASAKYTASLIAGAKFIGFDEGGHTWVGHNDEVMAEIVKLLDPPVRP